MIVSHMFRRKPASSPPSSPSRRDSDGYIIASPSTHEASHDAVMQRLLHACDDAHVDTVVASEMPLHTQHLTSICQQMQHADTRLYDVEPSHAHTPSHTHTQSAIITSHAYIHTRYRALSLIGCSVSDDGMMVLGQHLPRIGMYNVCVCMCMSRLHVMQ